MAAVGALLCI
nr:unnamed protein product [Callosobruchus analis]